MTIVQFSTDGLLTAQRVGVTDDTWRQFVVAAARQGKSAEQALHDLMRDYAETHNPKVAA